MPKNQDLANLEQSAQKLQAEDEDHENLCLKNREQNNYGTNEIQTVPNSGHSHGIHDLQKECDELISNSGKEDKFHTLKIFMKIFLLIFASEIGDRSQISTIYLTNNLDKVVVILSSILAQVLLSIIAIFGGVLISSKISERNLTLIAGATFIVFAAVALYLLIVNDLLVMNVKKNEAVSSIVNSNQGVNSGEDFIPNKRNIISNYS